MHLLPKHGLIGNGRRHPWEKPSEDTAKRRKLYWNLIRIGMTSEPGQGPEEELLNILLTITNYLADIQTKVEQEEKLKWAGATNV